MEFERYFPVWSKLTAAQQERIRNSIVHQQAKKGTILHNGSLDCTGVFLIETGQLRAYILSDEGREITLYRLFDGDICLFSAACMMRSIVFDMIIETQKDTSIWMIPVHVYKSIMFSLLYLHRY